MIKLAKQRFLLTPTEPTMNPTSDELADVIIQRLGLMPRKSGSTERMHKILIQLYEQAKVASKEKNQIKAILTVEEMAHHAGITRQTMYDYLKRWLALNIIIKTSYILDNKVIIGYKLNGTTLEAAYEKAFVQIQNSMQLTLKYVSELQKLIKNEKISQTQKINNLPGSDDVDSFSPSADAA